MVSGTRSVRLLSLGRLIRVSQTYRRPLNSQAAQSSENPVNRDLLNSFNEDIKSGGVVPVFRRALLWPTRPAVQDELGVYTYAGLHQAAHSLSLDISKQLGGESGTTVAYLCSNDASHVIVQWAIWMSGNIAVPLTSLHPPAMLQYFIEDSGAALVVCAEEQQAAARAAAAPLHRPLLVASRARQITAQLDQADNGYEGPQPPPGDVGRSNAWYAGADAMLIYTSGTTSKPKGVVWSHAAWATQVAALQQAWQYSAADVVLHTLPLHHIHGQLNSLNASLAAGARVRMLGAFSPHAVWARLLGMGEREEARVSVFHGVPAAYARLAAEHAAMFAAPRTRDYVRATLASRLRLMCSGSAPLPATLFRKWEEISGHRLLERYGMSEVGMAISNPYRPTEGRVPATVGLPLPGVSARIAAARGDTLQPLVTVHTPEPSRQISLERLGVSGSVKDLFSEPGSTEQFRWRPPRTEHHEPAGAGGVHEGELLLKGPAVFKRYWNRAPQLASADFTADGWFRTGDTASYSDNGFQILGRTSVDIIKTGGYKVSAVQLEALLLEHERIADAAVVGAPDATWGERVCVAVALAPERAAGGLTLPELRAWAADKMAPYQVPSRLLVLDALPRNHMGKLDKKAIVKLFTAQQK